MPGCCKSYSKPVGYLLCHLDSGYTSSMEPLLSLREAAVAGQLDRVELTADTVTLADRTYPRDTPTSWKTGTDTFYTLATLITFLQHGHKPLPEYMASMRAARVDRVGFDAREVCVAAAASSTLLISRLTPDCPLITTQDLRSYFSGKIDSHPNIQQSVPSLDLAQVSPALAHGSCLAPRA